MEKEQSSILTPNNDLIGVKKSEKDVDKTWENEAEPPAPMVQISLKEYDKLKENSKYITDKSLISVIDKIEELVRALRKHIVRKEID